MVYLVKKMINRDTIYIGQVEICEVKFLERDEKGKLYVPFKNGSRSILFQPSDVGKSVDLLNTKVENYPILNFSRDDTCFKSNVLVANSYYIGDLLRKYGFPLNLKEDEIRKIKKYLILLKRIKLLEHKVSFWDLKKFKKDNAFQIYRDSIYVPQKVMQIVRSDASFAPLSVERKLKNR